MCFVYQRHSCHSSDMIATSIVTVVISRSIVYSLTASLVVLATATAIITQGGVGKMKGKRQKYSESE